MNKLINHIKKINNLYHSFKKNYAEMQKMFHHHSVISQKIKLSEQILMQAYILIAEKTEEVATRREFDKVIKGARDAEQKRDGK